MRVQTQSQQSDTGPTSSSTDPTTPGAWQGSHRSTILYDTGATRPKSPALEADFQPLGYRDSRSGVFCLFLFVGYFTSQLHASKSQGRIRSGNFTCCHTEIQVADQTFYLILSQYSDTAPTSPRADPRTSGAWKGSHWIANF